MIVVQPPKANLVLQKKQNRKFVPQVFIIIYRIIHVLFGFDFGFFDYKTKKIRFLSKYFRVFSTLTISTISLLCAYIYSTQQHFTFYVYFVIEYLTFLNLILIFNNPLCNFIHVMGAINVELSTQNFSRALKLNVVITLAALFLFFRSTLAFLWCSRVNIDEVQCVRPQWVLIVFYMILFSHDFILLSNILAYYIVYINLVTLSRTLEEDDLFNLCNKYNNIYKSIVDATEEIKKSFDPLFFAALIFNVPEIITYIYSIVFQLRNDQITLSSSEPILASLSTLGTLILNILPALVAGMLNSKAYQIRVILNNKLLFKKGEHASREHVTKSRNIIKFIEYVEARPMLFYVYKIIPLNADLLGIVLNFCVTNLIVIIQLTHLY